MKPASPAFIKTLKRAHLLFAEGKASEAAPLFAQLATQTDKEGIQRRTATLHARAAPGFAEAHNEALALAHAQKALRPFTQLQMVWRAPAFYQTITRMLEAQKMPRAANTLRSEFSQAIVVLIGEARKEPALPTSRLPETCPACNAPTRSDEVDWINASRAECDYCGNVMSAG